MNKSFNFLWLMIPFVNSSISRIKPFKYFLQGMHTYTKNPLRVNWILDEIIDCLVIKYNTRVLSRLSDSLHQMKECQIWDGIYFKRVQIFIEHTIKNVCFVCATNNFLMNIAIIITKRMKLKDGNDNWLQDLFQHVRI